jgi:hypothetical protein
VIVALNHCSDLDSGKALQESLSHLDPPLIVDVLSINSSSGLGLPELEHRIVDAGHRARLVAAPTPKPLCLLQQAVRLWFHSNGPLLSLADFSSLCLTCLVKNADDAKRLLHERGCFVDLGTNWLFDSKWLGVELCTVARSAAPSESVDVKLHEVLQATAIERNLCVTTENGSVAPFSALLPQAPADALATIADSVPTHRTLFRVDSAIANGVQYRVMCGLSRLRGDEKMRLKHIWQEGAFLQSETEMGWVRMLEQGFCRCLF